ncbi:integrase arm-type DNA-binding domain-containing protein [Geobacter hydrogenophilus]|uniref:Integrase n=1 Tax=Geobacter hydrogenophilus TaxID=40983 RepID=A0A9W6FZJ3_9BACT|nr:integrase arm-type DNA-binding domain-containing protein [Geobacter hydrogenophilus]MBT0893552.1 integrase arm-type DNA-binding domain-containing protein [Geobacter hydrogenophilus]GLI37751.1 integrase [Geobacter hydrogenophilus]
MPKRIQPLTELKIKNAKPAPKDYKLFDGGGLFLLVTPAGGKLWHLKYRFAGKEQKLTFGPYPTTSLADARQHREDAKKLLASGVDPGEIKKAKKEELAAEQRTFERVAREWFTKNEPAWSASHCSTVMSRLERDIFPVIGSRPITEVKRVEIISLLKGIEARGKIETAKRIKIYCGQIFRYALNHEWVESNPTADLKIGDILTKAVEKHHAAITEPKQVAELLRAIDAYTGTFVVKCALQLAPLVFVRPGELQKAEWSEFDLDTAEWNIPASRMKSKQPHLVPLAKQAITILRELHKLTGDGKYLFPSLRSHKRPMSNVAMLAAFRRMGYDKEEMTTHGFRAMARTILDEVLQIRPDFIEHQLAHAVRDPLGRAYNRTSHLAERKKMMQLWADYLDGLKAGAKVITLTRTAL